jgi:hypothetical protein
MSTTTPRFVLTLEPLPDPAPPAVRLRALLKFALRRLRLRCVDAREGAGGTPAEGPGVAQDATLRCPVGDVPPPATSWLLGPPGRFPARPAVRRCAGDSARAGRAGRDG